MKITNKDNRQTQENFECVVCGYQNNADSALRTEVTPHEIIQNMLDKGMDVWASLSDKSYGEARDNIGYYASRVTRYDADKPYPVQTRYVSWKYAVPIYIATMTEITEVPK